MSNKKALVVGINIYKTSKNNLPSCVNDSNKFSDLLKDSYGFTDICKIQNREATFAKIDQQLEWLFKNAEPNAQLVFYYSGHGYRTPKDGLLKECLVTSDEKFFFDDKFSTLTQRLPPGILSIILDCCHSGGMEKAFFSGKSGEERPMVKAWVPPDEELENSSKPETDRTLPYQKFGQSITERNFVSTNADASSSLKSLISQPKSKQVNGLLMSACKANEKAIASTVYTNGLSVFTFGLIRSISSLGTKISNNTLLDHTTQQVQKQLKKSKLGQTQTPLLIEPDRPKGLGNLSFITFEPAEKSASFTDKPAEKSPVFTDKPAEKSGVFTDEPAEKSIVSTEASDRAMLEELSQAISGSAKMLSMLADISAMSNRD
ncbi:caspase family protein [Dapis sp. BLCC M126]|uniref:caspase family protein n=1 Tax=Dapis sp. BLCC M126 TaxID=3400189 RepID=UPI003CEFCAE3